MIDSQIDHLTSLRPQANIDARTDYRGLRKLPTESGSRVAIERVPRCTPSACRPFDQQPHDENFYKNALNLVYPVTLTECSVIVIHSGLVYAGRRCF